VKSQTGRSYEQHAGPDAPLPSLSLSLSRTLSFSLSLISPHLSSLSSLSPLSPLSISSLSFSLSPLSPLFLPSRPLLSRLLKVIVRRETFNKAYFIFLVSIEHISRDAAVCDAQPCFVRITRNHEACRNAKRIQSIVVLQGVTRILAGSPKTTFRKIAGSV